MTGFDTWTSAEGPAVQVEGQAPESWDSELTARGHRVELRPETIHDWIVDRRTESTDVHLREMIAAHRH